MSKDFLNQAEDNRTEIVFCVKFNRKIFADQRLKDFLQGVFIEIEKEFGKTPEGVNFFIEDVEIFSNYVRMVVCYNPLFGVHNAVRKIKRQSAKKLKDFDPSLMSRLPAIWTNQTKFKTIGVMSTEKEIEDYIEAQTV